MTETAPVPVMKELVGCHLGCSIHAGHSDIGNVIEGLEVSVHMGISINMQRGGRVLAGTFIFQTIIVKPSEHQEMPSLRSPNYNTNIL